MNLNMITNINMNTDMNNRYEDHFHKYEYK